MANSPTTETEDRGRYYWTFMYFANQALIPQPLLPNLGEGELDKVPLLVLGEGFRERVDMWLDKYVVTLSWGKL